MSRRTIHLCDICKNEFPEEDKLTFLKVLVPFGFSRIREEWEICEDCLTEIRVKVKSNRREGENPDIIDARGIKAN